MRLDEVKRSLYHTPINFLPGSKKSKPSITGDKKGEFQVNHPRRPLWASTTDKGAHLYHNYRYKEGRAHTYELKAKGKIADHRDPKVKRIIAKHHGKSGQSDFHHNLIDSGSDHDHVRKVKKTLQKHGYVGYTHPETDQKNPPATKGHGFRKASHDEFAGHAQSTFIFHGKDVEVKKIKYNKDKKGSYEKPKKFKSSGLTVPRKKPNLPEHIMDNILSVLDETSAGRMRDYVSAGTRDVSKRVNKLANSHDQMTPDRLSKKMNKVGMRKIGIGRAKRRLNMEQVERLNELSKNLMKRYGKKASIHADTLYGRAARHGSNARNLEKMDNRIIRREKGLSLANRRLKNEELEQLIEISDKLKKTYEKKAYDSSKGAIANKDMKTLDKRAKGMMRASKKTNEEVELVELNKKTLQSYHKQSSEQIKNLSGKLKGLGPKDPTRVKLRGRKEGNENAIERLQGTFKNRKAGSPYRYQRYNKESFDTQLDEISNKLAQRYMDSPRRNLQMMAGTGGKDTTWRRRKGFDMAMKRGADPRPKSARKKPMITMNK